MKYLLSLESFCESQVYVTSLELNCDAEQVMVSQAGDKRNVFVAGNSKFEKLIPLTFVPQRINY